MIELLAGAVAGSAHVLAGPDHLAAVAPLAADRRRAGWRPGLRWGIGHAAGVAAVGALAVGLRSMLPAGTLEAVSGWSERIVGVVLIGIGLWALRRAFRTRVHVHRHSHGGRPHVHVHLHATTADHDRAAAHGHTHAALAVGALHGLAGSSHVLGVLPALALPLPGAIAWLAGFGLGSVAAMTAFAAGIGGIAGRAASWHRGFVTVTAGVAIVMGGVWLVR